MPMWMNFSEVVTWSHSLGSIGVTNAGGVAGPGVPGPTTPSRHDAGQDSSMFLRASEVDSPVIQAVISFQNEPAPTALGIWSEPSKRKTDSGSWNVSAESRSIGLVRLLASSPVLALTQPPPGVALAFSFAQMSDDR